MLRIPAGDIVQVYYGPANRDPKEFPNADEFRLDATRATMPPSAQAST